MSPTLRTIIYANTIPVIILIIFLILVAYNPIFNRKQARFFTLAASTALFMIVVLVCDKIFSSYNYQPFVTLRTVTTFLNFVISPIIPILLDKISNFKKNSFYFYIPFIINIILCLISISNGIIFSIGSNNGYGRGILFFVPFAITILYTVVLLIRSNYRYLRTQYSERIFLLVVIAVLFLAMILEIVYHFLFFVWTTAAISLPLYYLLLNINQSILDPLTKSYNRLMYTKDIERIDTKKECIVALLDINNFKSVNDTYGHDYGDKYLINLVSIISHSLPSTCSIYRIGGDEFVIISKSTDLKKVNNYLKSAKKEALKNNMDFSYGIDIYQLNQTFNKFFKHIDSLMYENKKIDKSIKKGMQ